ncbi:esterase-like activity of phytase family protein [Spongiimicrobium salis]|uniref:esterase-like activity of phytase family protein n=1 Tax=Spongiimicrobium salis TaxID=1667022 RepID=UPI00374D1850
MKNQFFFYAMLLGCLCSCDRLDDFIGGGGNGDDGDTNTIGSLRFIGEQIIPDNTLFNGHVIGGLSGIDYANGNYYLISDAPTAPIRFYRATLDFDANAFTGVTVFNEVELLTPQNDPFGENEADPEAIRFDPKTGNILWASEGYVDDRNVNPFIREASLSGAHLRNFNVPALFQANPDANAGPRNNGTFEGLSLSHDGSGFWVGMELPLIQDGPAPVFETETDSPVRIAFIDRESGNFRKQFAYELDPVVRDGGFTVNGLVELLEYEKNKFLVLERSFASGFDDGGNNVRIYSVDASNATDVSSLLSLENVDFTPATKTLLFDFESIRSQLSTVPGSSASIVDNIEGITFGPQLANGNRSLVVVADNNFSAFGAQLNQFIVFEVLS